MSSFFDKTEVPSLGFRSEDHILLSELDFEETDFFTFIFWASSFLTDTDLLWFVCDSKVSLLSRFRYDASRFVVKFKGQVIAVRAFFYEGDDIDDCFLVVDPQFRSRGVAKACIRWTVGFNVKVSTGTHVENLAMQTLFEAAGYSFVGVEDNIMLYTYYV